jgi:hypothetical protein
MRSVATWLCAVMALSAVGCATAGQGGDLGTVGELQLPLVTTAADGATYRLTATFQATDVNSGASEQFDASGEETSLTVALPSSSYRFEILPGFSLARSASGAPFVPVDAVLASANPMTVIVQSGQTTFLFFQFLVPAANNEADGFLHISFGVLLQRGQLVGTMSVQTANGIFTPYVGAPPVSFVAPYAIGGEGVFSTPPAHEFFSSGVGLRVDNDPIGVVAQLAPSFSGGFLAFRIEVAPDLGQSLNLRLSSTGANGLSELFVATADLQPRVPVEPSQGIPNDPVRSGFRANVPFSLTFSDAGGFSVMSGQLDLQFAP